MNDVYKNVSVAFDALVATIQSERERLRQLRIDALTNGDEAEEKRWRQLAEKLGKCCERVIAFSNEWRTPVENSTHQLTKETQQTQLVRQIYSLLRDAGSGGLSIGEIAEATAGNTEKGRKKISAAIWRDIRTPNTELVQVAPGRYKRAKAA